MADGNGGGMWTWGGAGRRNRSAWWCLLPVLLGMPGGVIAWFALRHDDPRKAKICFWLGMSLMALWLVVRGVLGDVVPSSDSDHMYVWR